MVEQIYCDLDIAVSLMRMPLPGQTTDNDSRKPRWWAFTIPCIQVHVVRDKRGRAQPWRRWMHLGGRSQAPGSCR